MHRGPTGWASRPKRLWAPARPPAVPWGSATVLVPPHGPQPRWDYVCLFICFCLNSDLFHVWFENFQTQKSKKLGRIWCPCLLPAVARGLGPTPLPCGAEASQGDAARASDTGGGCGPCLGGGRGQAGHTSGCAGLHGCGWAGGGRAAGGAQEQQGWSLEYMAGRTEEGPLGVAGRLTLKFSCCVLGREAKGRVGHPGGHLV